MKKTVKRITSLLLVIITLASIFCSTTLMTSAASAKECSAFDVPNSTNYAKVYTMSTSGNTIPYTSKSLSTRGTTNGASKNAYIANSTDELYLFDVGKTNGKTWAYVSYPVSSGRRNAYIYLSAISPASYGSNKQLRYTALGKFYCSPRRGGSFLNSYYVDKGDTVYAIGGTMENGAYFQIMYPISNGKWRIGWTSYANAKKYLDGTSSSTPSTKSYTGYVNTNSSPLVLRQSASTSSKALANMPKGSSLTVLDNKAKTNGFYHVKYNGTTGYASASYISFTKPKVKTISLNVPLYKQNDSRWKNTYIGTKTIGAVGCTTTCVAMIYSYKYNTTCYPNTMRNKLNYSNNSLYWSSLKNVGLSYSDAYNCYLNQSIMSTIYSKLKAGHPVMIGCNGTSSRGQHWVVVTGFTGSNTSTFNASDFRINDPGGANDTTLAGFVYNRGTVCRIAW